MKVINLTPHVIRLNDGREFPPSGKVARVSVFYNTTRPLSLFYLFVDRQTGESKPDLQCDEQVTEYAEDLPFYEQTYGEIEGLPERTYKDVLYIVSSMVLAALKHNGDGRIDVVAPATGHHELKRDQNGNIVSVPGFTY